MNFPLVISVKVTVQVYDSEWETADNLNSSGVHTGLLRMNMDPEFTIKTTWCVLRKIKLYQHNQVIATLTDSGWTDLFNLPVFDFYWEFSKNNVHKWRKLEMKGILFVWAYKFSYMLLYPCVPSPNKTQSSIIWVKQL